MEKNYWKNKFEESVNNSEEHSRSLWTKDGYLERKNNFIRLYEKYCNSFDTVLDIGCGPGNYFDIYRSKKLQITGLDFSEQQLNRARDAYPEAELFLGTIDAIDKNKKFDLIVSIGVTQYVEDIEDFLSQISNHLSDKGIAVISFLNDKTVKPKDELDKKMFHYSKGELQNLLSQYYKIIDYKRIYVMPENLKFIKPILRVMNPPLLNHAFMFVLKKNV